MKHIVFIGVFTHPILMVGRCGQIDIVQIGRSQKFAPRHTAAIDPGHVQPQLTLQMEVQTIAVILYDLL